MTAAASQRTHRMAMLVADHC